MEAGGYKQQHEPPTAMSVYIDSTSHLHHDLDKNLVVTCPHCQAVAHITPSAVPRFEDLQLYRPRQVGLVYQCDACHMPIFLRFTVRVYGATRIELSPQFTEVERAREKFSFTYVPEDSRAAVPRGAHLLLAGGLQRVRLDVPPHRAGACLPTWAKRASCGCSMSSTPCVSSPASRPEIFTKMRNVLFGAELEAHSPLPLLDGYEAGIMLEVVKDLLYEAYVRKGKLQQAMMVRRFFLDETGNHVAPLVSAS